MSEQAENLRQLMQCSETSIPTSLSDAQSKLKPATAASGTAELMACLTLVAPSGMTAEDRNAWVQVARATLSGMPADLLAIGCKEARRRCRFASEIVPTIVEATQSLWDHRKQQLAYQQQAYANRFAPKIEKPTYPPIPREETQRILREIREARSVR